MFVISMSKRWGLARKSHKTSARETRMTSSGCDAAHPPNAPTTSLRRICVSRLMWKQISCAVLELDPYQKCSRQMSLEEGKLTEVAGGADVALRRQLHERCAR